MNAISEVEVEGAALARRRHRDASHTRSRGSATAGFRPSSSCCRCCSSSVRSRGTRSCARSVMSFQHTNLVQAPTWVGWSNFSAVIHDPQTPIAVKNTAYFALLALVFGYPIPLAAAVLMSELRQAARAVQRARLPAGGDPARRRGPALEDVLRRELRSASSTRSSAGSGLGPYPWLQSQHWAMPSLVLESTWANAGGDGDHLPRRAHRR